MNRLISIIKKYAPNNDEVLAKSDLKSDLGLCSLDLMQIILEVEELLQKKFNPKDIGKVHTVEDFWNCLEDISQ